MREILGERGNMSLDEIKKATDEELESRIEIYERWGRSGEDIPWWQLEFWHAIENEIEERRKLDT
jgi:hypothetical protein